MFMQVSSNVTLSLNKKYLYLTSVLEYRKLSTKIFQHLLSISRKINLKMTKVLLIKCKLHIYKNITVILIKKIIDLDC